MQYIAAGQSLTRVVTCWRRMRGTGTSSKVVEIHSGLGGIPFRNSLGLGRPPLLTSL